MSYWCVMTKEFDSIGWAPLVVTFARSKRSAIKKYGTCTSYYENNLKNGKARAIEIEIKEKGK